MTTGLRLQAFPFMVASLFLSIATHCLLSLYGTVHWRVAGPSAHLAGIAHELQMRSEDQRRPSDAELICELTNVTKVLATGTASLMRSTGAYHYTGWVALVLAVLTFFGKPRWAGWVALPPALYAAFLTGVMM